jgi:hypothetical protein
MKTRLERFMDKVELTDYCWNWKGATNGVGYGQFWNGNKNMQAHWFLLADKPKNGMEACHRCDNRLCVRPSHIFIGTRSDNMADCVRKGRHVGRINEYRNNRKIWHRGESNHGSKLTKEQAMECKKCPDEFGAATKLARKFGVHVSVVTGIKKGIRWKHIS